MRVCGLSVLSAPSMSETERGAGGAGTANPSSTAAAAEPVRLGSAASAARALAQTTPSDSKLGANLSGNALGEDVNVETTRDLQFDPATTTRTANAGPALPRGAGISALRHIDANYSAFNMLNEAGAAAALTPNEVVPPTSTTKTTAQPLRRPAPSVLVATRPIQRRPPALGPAFRLSANRCFSLVSLFSEFMVNQRRRCPCTLRSR